MNKIAKHIEIVRSSDSTLSSMSQKSCDAVLATLRKHYQTVGVSIVNNLFDLNDLVILNPDLVFLGMKFVPTNTELGRLDPNKIWVTKFLEEHNISYTGSGYSSHNYELDKQTAKQRVADYGLNTSKFFVARQGVFINKHDITIKYPVFIKPTDRGGGLGVDNDSIANNFEELIKKVHQISRKYRSDSLIEEFLPGREFSVAILKNGSSYGYSIMPLELVAEPNSNGERLLGGKLKSSNTEAVLNVEDGELKEKICELAINSFDALGARDYGRIDIRLDRTGAPQFLEANLLPSLISGYGNFPKACKMHKDMDYDQMLNSIVDLGFKHYELAETLENTIIEFVPSNETDIHLIATA